MNKETKQFEQMITEGRETGNWSEGTEWSTAERHVYEALVEKSRKLMQNGIAKDKEQAISEAVKLYFGNRRYYQSNDHANYPKDFYEGSEKRAESNDRTIVLDTIVVSEEVYNKYGAEVIREIYNSENAIVAFYKNPE